MSPLDAAFIHIEDDNNPMHIGSVAVFEGPPPAYGDVVRLVAGKLPLVPRYRQKVREVPFHLGRPVWVDDPHFTILYHIRRTGVPRPGGPDELRNLAGRVLAQHLDRSRPLWELWIVEGLEDDHWALISKVHHAMVDGVSGTDLMTVIFDLTPEQSEPVDAPWRPRPEPSAAQLIADAVAGTVTEPLEQVKGLPALARSPARTLQEALELGVAILGSMARLALPTADSLNGPVGPHRRWSWARGSLDEVKKIRTAFGGTVNDVVLAVITAGFRELLLQRGEEVEGKVVRTLVPVSVRSDAERGTYNNRVSGLFADLPVGLADPIERLESLRGQMEGLKQSKQAMAGDALTQLGGFAPPMLLALGARVGTLWPRPGLNTVTTNVPGPQFPLYVAGRRLLEAYPYVPIGGALQICVAIFSYMGRLNFGITGDYDGAADIDVLCAGIESGMAELLALAEGGSRPAPPAARRRSPRRKATTRAGSARRTRRAPAVGSKNAGG